MTPIFVATCHQMVKDSIRKSGFLSSVSDNRLNAIIENNITNIIGASGKTGFKKKSDLAIAVEHLSNAYAKDPSPKAIKELMYAKHSPLASGSYDQVTSAFQNKLSAAHSELGAIKDAVASLMQKFESNEKKFLKGEKEKSYKDTPLKYEDWNVTSHLGPEDTLIDEINSAYGGGDEPTIMAYDAYVNKIHLKADHTAKELKVVVLPQERKDAIVSAISSASGLSLQVTRWFCDALFSPEGMKHFTSDLCNLTSRFNVDAFEYVSVTCSKIQKFFRGYNKVVVPKDNEATYLDNDTVKANIQTLQAAQKGYIYYLCNLRYNNWKKLLILPNGSINQDLKDVALSSGVTKDDLRLFVHQKEYANVGACVTVDYITQKKDFLLNLHNKEMEHKATLATINEKETMLAAFDVTIRDYLKANNTHGKMDTLAHYVAQEVASCTLSPEYGFYKIVMEEKGTSPLSKSIFEEFGKGFTSLASQCEGAPDKRMVEETQAAVLTNFIGKFIVDNFC